MSNRLKVERVNREIIEEKLMVSLSKGNHVAILASKEDLDLLIEAMDTLWAWEPRNEKAKRFALDMKRLRKEAFPK